jgi:hypothetical protein
MSYHFYFWILNYMNIFKNSKKLFPSFANDSERSFVIIRERSRMITNDHEWSRMIMNVHERSRMNRTFENVHERSRIIFTNKNVGNFWMTKIVNHFFPKKYKEPYPRQDILLNKQLKLFWPFFRKKSFKRGRQVTFGPKKSKTFKRCY